MSWNAQTRQSRQQIGKFAEEALKQTLLSYGFTVKETGQETWLPTNIQSEVRYEFDDEMARAVRYIPDFIAYHPKFPMAYWDSKANVTPNTSNFAIEKASYQEQMARVDKGERVAIAFWEINKTWHINWVEKLMVGRDMSHSRNVSKGSHTPFLLIPKLSTMPLKKFLQTYGTLK